MAAPGACTAAAGPARPPPCARRDGDRAARRASSSSRAARRASTARAASVATSTTPPDISSADLSRESLVACGWHELCEHLAGYASTALGQEACRTLPLPSEGPWASEALLDETSAAVAMESHHGVSLDFGGILSA